MPEPDIESGLPPFGLIRLRPRLDEVYLARGRTALITGLDGFFAPEASRGLFERQTRLLSRYRILINGKQPRLVSRSAVSRHSWVGYYLAPLGKRPEDETEQTTELRLWRFVGNGLHEEIDLRNYSKKCSRFLLQIEISADFVSLRETNGKRVQFGRTTERVRRDRNGLEVRFDYHAEHRYHHQGDTGTATLNRGLIVRLEHASSGASYSSRALSFPIDLSPGENWHACLEFQPLIEGKRRSPLYTCGAYARTNQEDAAERSYLNSSTDIVAGKTGALSAIVLRAFQSAERDLASLRLYDLEEGKRAWVPAAGSPKYLELFGRDPLITGMQSAFVSPEILRGILTELPKWQGTRRDDWRDEAPGRLIHQVQEDPLSRLCYGPLGRYYGSLSAPALYAEGLFAHWAWTGDSEEARRFIAPALKAMRWLETTAENDKDRFYAYYTRSEQGVKNQSWKDSGDAIVYEDGSLVPDPIATSEMQGVAYSAKLHLGFLLSRLGEKALGIRLQEEARELQKRFNDHFWMEPEGYFALGKDSQGRLIRSISSDPGACLASGIVDEGLAKRTADRLMKPDLFSGWGVRTLSSDHPAYDPFSYHRGSVWPVENAFIAVRFPGIRRASSAGAIRSGFSIRLLPASRGVLGAPSQCREPFSGTLPGSHLAAGLVGFRCFERDPDSPGPVPVRSARHSLRRPESAGMAP
jgi:glycogen debranching enzyme